MWNLGFVWAAQDPCGGQLLWVSSGQSRVQGSTASRRTGQAELYGDGPVEQAADITGLMGARWRGSKLGFVRRSCGRRAWVCRTSLPALAGPSAHSAGGFESSTRIPVLARTRLVTRADGFWCTPSASQRI